MSPIVCCCSRDNWKLPWKIKGIWKMLPQNHFFLQVKQWKPEQTLKELICARNLFVPFIPSEDKCSCLWIGGWDLLSYGFEYSFKVQIQLDSFGKDCIETLFFPVGLMGGLYHSFLMWPLNLVTFSISFWEVEFCIVLSQACE